MRKNRISESIGNINQKYVSEAETYAAQAKVFHGQSWMKWGTIAACLCFVAAAIFAVPHLYGDHTIKDGAVISEYSSGSIIDHSYAAPAPGEYYCFVEVNEARKEYAGKEVSYLLSFDVFKGGEDRMSIEELSEEYQRLSDLGYKLYYVEDHWTYYGDNQKQYVPVVVGLFTEEELANFQASEQYGYAFHFETNGDGSPVSVEGESVVTNFNSVMY